MQRRPYQIEAIDALERHWQEGCGNPLVAMATATGKSPLIAWHIYDICQRYHARILVLVHVQELVQQDLDHLLAVWPDAPVGVNCSALGRRDWDNQIVIASIQSVFRSPEKLGHRDLVIVDEAHLIPRSDSSMYRSLFKTLSHPDFRIVGFTATPWRLDSGLLTEGDDKIFDKVVYVYGIGRGIKDGYLAPLTSKATETQLDVSRVGRRGGEFIDHQLQKAVDIESVVNSACNEIVAHGVNRRCWLVFAAGVAHAEHICTALRARGVTAECVFGETPQADRERIIADYKAENIHCLVNVSVLTTGFNVPQVDLIAMLRPTLSTGLYVQQVGRGTRKAHGKTNCLVLDFAGNVRRHGPVDCVDINIEGRSGDGEAPTKVCPQCEEINPISVTECRCCGYEWPKAESKIKHAPAADTVPILGSNPSWHQVDQISITVHIKRNEPSAPPSLHVSYRCGFTSVDEWISIQRVGWPRAFAERWWLAHGGRSPVPVFVSEAVRRKDELKRVAEICIVKDGKWWRVVRRRLDDGTEIDRDYRIVNPARTFATFTEEIGDSIRY